VLVGGDEFRPGNEHADDLLVAAADALDGHRPAFVIATAAARQQPDQAVETARTWFAERGLAVEELRLRKRREANAPATADLARTGRFFYLCGGDPGLTVQILERTIAWESIVAAWRDGAVLAGSSAGAMALGEWTLIRARRPGDARREPRPALAVVPGIAVAPHWSTFGRRWLPSAREALPPDATIVGIDERTAALWTDGQWRVRGPGKVVVVADDREASFSNGETIDSVPAPSRA
jgi:cyanophycinase